MRGIRTSVSDLRKKIFSEVAKIALEEASMSAETFTLFFTPALKAVLFFFAAGFGNVLNPALSCAFLSAAFIKIAFGLATDAAFKQMSQQQSLFSAGVAV